MAAQWPLVVAKLVGLLPTLSGWTSSQVTVFEGAAVSVETPLFATVAHATDGTNVHTGSYVLTQAADGFRYVEQGTVVCQIATNEPSDMASLRSSMFSLLNSLEASIRGDRRLGGVLSVEGTSGLTVDMASTAATGTTYFASITFSVDYTTVT